MWRVYRAIEETQKSLKNLSSLKELKLQTVDKTLLVSTPEAFFLFSVQKVCT